MTKEELEKEADEYAREWLYHVKDLELHHKEDDKPEYIRIKEAYLAGAEPREKQIEIDAKQIITLQKDKGELTDKVKELEAELSKLKPYRCKNKYAVSEKETSNAVLCYRVQNCESCGHFKE